MIFAPIYGIVQIGSVHIKAPWRKPLFSERNGYKKPFLRLFGFRFFKLDEVRK